MVREGAGLPVDYDYTIVLLPRAEHNLTIQAVPGQPPHVVARRAGPSGSTYCLGPATGELSGLLDP